MIDLFNPNRDELLSKWAHVLKATERIWTWDTQLELAWLAEYATRCAFICEVGCYVGRSAVVMLEANPKLKILGIDLWEVPDTQQEFHFNTRKYSDRLNAINTDSHKGLGEFLNGFINLPEMECDGCFIDGGHTREIVYGDIQKLRLMMAPGSIMAGHDFHPEDGDANGVSQAVWDHFPRSQVHNPVDSIWCVQL